jgi:predicted nucleotidyltransferase component of viral defense system
MSFFKYPYRPIKQLIPIEDIYIVSKEDIAAMKILAISQRGTRRDFIDIFFLMKEFGLKSILEFTKEKYPMFNIYIGLQGLVYFEDAEGDPQKQRFRLLCNVNWKHVKSYLIEEVNNIKKLL